MIIVVGGIKGGSGKTTIATNLSVLRASTGKKVLLVDADDQRSAYDWYNQREESKPCTSLITIPLDGKSLHTQIKKLSLDYDDVIVDVGGRDTTSQRSALVIAEKYIIPFKPRSLDIWTLGKVKSMIEEIMSVNPNLLSYALINQADSKGTDNNDAIQILSDCGCLKILNQSIGHRKSFANAASMGLAVSEIKIDSKAIKEIENLYKEIYTL